jgi:hypothetical protein
MYRQDPPATEQERFQTWHSALAAWTDLLGQVNASALSAGIDGWARDAREIWRFMINKSPQFHHTYAARFALDPGLTGLSSTRHKRRKDASPVDAEGGNA